MVLSQRDHPTIQSLSRANVEKTLAGLRRFTKRSKWVSNNNQYSIDTITRLAAELRVGPVNNPRHLSQYIAASCLLHCSDGWSYLGKSILSLLRGDPHRSRHMAYYAELRAAMSLLATEGIGIFSNQHFAVTAPNSVTRLHTNEGTHKFAWHCLEFWAGQAASSDLFAELIQPYGRCLNDWLAPYGGGSVVAPQAQDWFRQWGVDLKVLPEDREARNVSSYRPDGIPESWRLDASFALNFVREFWTALEPSSASQFETIDRHLLRIALESVFEGQTGRSPSEDAAQFEQFVSAAMVRQGLAPKVEKQWIDFVCRRVAVEDLAVLFFARKSSQVQDGSEAAVISRAALLLRVASGSTSKLLTAAGIVADSTEFWWDGLGQGRGLWDGPREADALVDLWADIPPLLQEIERFQQRVSPQDQTFFRVGTELGHVLVGLGSCERAAIWSMTP